MAKTGSKRKQTVAFLKSGALKGQIDARHKRKDFAQKKKGRDAKRNKGVLPAHQQPKADVSDDEFEEVKRRKEEADEVDSDEDEGEMGVDDVLGAEGLGSDGGDANGDEGEVRPPPFAPRPVPSSFPPSRAAADSALLPQDDGSDLEDDDLSDLEDDEGQHMADIAALAQKDPDFFKYLQENDPELLDFADQDGAGAEDEDEDDEDDEMSEDEDSEDEASAKKGKKGKGKEKAQPKKARDDVLTKDVLRSWQKNILEVRPCSLPPRPLSPSAPDSTALARRPARRARSASSSSRSARRPSRATTTTRRWGATRARRPPPSATASSTPRCLRRSSRRRSSTRPSSSRRTRRTRRSAASSALPSSHSLSLVSVRVGY